MKQLNRRALNKVQGGFLSAVIRAAKYVAEFFAVDIASNPGGAADAFSAGFRDGLK